MQLSELKLATRAERHLCLARAFLPTLKQSEFDALREQLCPDLHDITAEFGEHDRASLQALGDALAAVPDRTTLLASYSRLFLAPPAPALLNLGFYLDGGLMGNTCQTIEALYQRHGLEQDAHFRDTADHLALYLQFIGWTMAQAEEQALAGDEGAARHILEDLNYTIVRHGLPAMQRLIAQIDKAERELHVLDIYGRLATLARNALLRDAEALQTVLPRPEAPTVIPGSEKLSTAARPGDGPATTCKACGKTFVADSGLETMIAALEAHGLGTDHMQICPDCRAGAMGMTALTSPRMKKVT
jgi:putative dimethyl sulfoxide reductase chaperone